VADQPPGAYGRGASLIPSGVFRVLMLPTVGLVVAFLYFRARPHRSARPCYPAEFSAGTGGASASPIAYRQSNSRYFDGTDSVSGNDRLYRGRSAGNILAGAAAAGVPFKPRDQKSARFRGPYQAVECCFGGSIDVSPAQECWLVFGNWILAIWQAQSRRLLGQIPRSRLPYARPLRN
jgi:hypothetical protein